MKKISFIDMIIIAAIVIALLVGISTAKHLRQTAGKQIEATSQIIFQVFLRGVTVTGEEFPVKKTRCSPKLHHNISLIVLSAVLQDALRCTSF